MDHAVFFLGFAHESAAIGFEDFDGFEDIVALEAEAGPGSFAFAAAVNADGASRGTLNAELRGTSGVSGLPKWRRAVSSRR